MLLIGHRGCKYAAYNQNTLRAFEKVTSEGVPAIEFDVQRCGDGELVIVHNLDLEEVSTGRGEVYSTDSATLKSLYAGDPTRGKDRIPFLSEVFDFFASVEPDKRPVIHMELKGDNTGKQAGELFKEYVSSGKLEQTDMLASSFNWQELQEFRNICPTARIALLDGLIRRRLLLEKTGGKGERYFADIFNYGNEDYMLPRFPTLPENLDLLAAKCDDQSLRELIGEELKACLNGTYYTNKLLDTACSMNATSVNLWFRTVSPEFIDKAHKLGLAVFVFTVNDPHDMQALADIGVDGIFTDFYADAAKLFATANP